MNQDDWYSKLLAWSRTDKRLERLPHVLMVILSEYLSKENMKLKFGYGNIFVTSYGDRKGNYGVAFRVVPEKHLINESDPSVIGKTFDEVPHDLYMEFAKSGSVQCVINKLEMVRDDLYAAEQSVHPTAFGARLRARLANWLFDMSMYLSQSGGG